MNLSYLTPPPPHPPTLSSEGLLPSYDFVILGTGLVQSILSASIALTHNYTVLHCDGSDRYGEETASYNLVDLLTKFGVVENSFPPCPSPSSSPSSSPSPSPSPSFLEPHFTKLSPSGNLSSLHIHSKTPISRLVTSLTPNTAVSTPYGPGVISATPSTPSTLITVKMTNWSATCTLSSSQVSPSINALLESITSSSHRFSLDLTPQLLYTSGLPVDSMVRCGVAKYLEFKGLEAVNFVNSNDNSNAISKVSDGGFC